jgi:hypothetical protein
MNTELTQRFMQKPITALLLLAASIARLRRGVELIPDKHRLAKPVPLHVRMHENASGFDMGPSWSPAGRTQHHQCDQLL